MWNKPYRYGVPYRLERLEQQLAEHKLKRFRGSKVRSVLTTSARDKSLPTSYSSLLRHGLSYGVI